MSTLERAIGIQAHEHAGQLDKGDQPYILHPLRVMTMVGTLSEQMAAVLHDVVEDTSVTFDKLIGEGFPDEVIEALRALTKSTGEGRMVAVKRAAVNAIARNVKLADVTDDMNLARIPHPTEKDFARIDEYKQVREVLIAHGATLAYPPCFGCD